MSASGYCRGGRQISTRSEVEREGMYELLPRVTKAAKLEMCCQPDCSLYEVPNSSGLRSTHP